MHKKKPGRIVRAATPAASDAASLAAQIQRHRREIIEPALKANERVPATRGFRVLGWECEAEKGG
jgi:hypothetical protein